MLCVRNSRCIVALSAAMIRRSYRLMDAVRTFHKNEIVLVVPRQRLKHFVFIGGTVEKVSEVDFSFLNRLKISSTFSLRISNTVYRSGMQPHAHNQ